MGRLQRILLDTSILIEILDREKYLELIQAEEVYLSVISIYEYIRYKKDKKFYKTKLEQAFTVLQLDNNILEKAAEIFTKLKEKGTPISENDIYIAATALAYDLELYTKDTDYQKIAEVEPKLKLKFIE